MSDQEIIDAIDAEIALTRNLSRRVKLDTPGAAETLVANICYVNGLRFARALIAKRMEGNLNTAQGADLDAGGAL